MNASTCLELSCCCKSKNLFGRLRASRDEQERSQLLLQLIDELQACPIGGDDPFHPWRRATRSEKLCRSEEAVTQEELARSGLRSVLVDSEMTFELKIAVLAFLVDRHVESADRPSHEQLTGRVVQLRRSVPPPAPVDDESDVAAAA